MATRKFCSINLDYLPIKAHYIFLFGGMGGTIPFMQVLAKDLGISATAVGLVYTIVPFCALFAKPMFGYITDLCRNIKLILMILIAVTSLAYLAVIFIPPIENYSEESFQVTALCADNHSSLNLQPSSYNQACFKEMVKKQHKCKFISNYCLSMKTFFEVLNVSSFIPNKENYFSFSFPPTENFLTKNTCDCVKNNYFEISCEMDISKFHSNCSGKSEYKTYTFWLYALSSVIAGAGSSTAFCLSDAACCEVLSKNPKLYGCQRAWATISWGITTFIVGYLNDFATGTTGYNNYNPGFYLMLAFVAIDLMILYRQKLLKANISTSICKDVGKIYQSRQTILFSLGVYIVGVLTGLIWNFQFWFLTDLGASQRLLGLVIAVQCLVVETPFLFFSNWFIERFGHFYCLIGSLAACSLRTGLFALLKDPWMALPIDLLHGITFGIFFTAMTMYATDFAPPGTEATMLGILGGLFDGLGVATGTLLGGVGFDKIGGQKTFFVASMISLACVPVFTIAYNILKRKSAKLLRDTYTNYDSENLGAISESTECLTTPLKH